MRRGGELTKSMILGHAMTLASRIGLHALTLGRLAEELEMSKSGIFAHFKAKETLELEVLEEASRRFISCVITPSRTVTTGLPRVRALFESWLEWDDLTALPGGCPFVQWSIEFDEQSGDVRERLLEMQQAWHEQLALVARHAKKEGHFRSDLDPEQFAFELYGIALSYHHSKRLLRDSKAKHHARAAFETLIQNAQPRRA